MTRTPCVRTLSVRVLMCYLLLVTPLIGATPRTARAAVVALPPLLQLVQDHQQQIYETLFPQGTYDENVFPYGLDAVVTGTGAYTGNAPDGPFTLNVTTAFPFDPITQGNGLISAEQLQEIADNGLTFITVYASLTTAAASVEVAGLAISAIDPTLPTPVSRFILMDYESEILPPGGGRNADPSGCSEDPADYDPPPADSVEICDAPTCEDDPNEGMRLNQQCLDDAENQWRSDMAGACRDYNDAIEEADDDYVDRIALATAGYVATLLVCAASAFIPFVGAGIATKCAIAATGVYASAIAYAEWKLAKDKKDAGDDYNTDVTRANTDLDFALSQCCEDCPKVKKKTSILPG